MRLNITFTANSPAFSGFFPVDKRQIGRLRCKTKRCFYQAYKKAGADIVVLGNLEGGNLRYQVYETWTGSKVNSGRIRLGTNITLVQIKHQAFRAVKPILERGGVLDQKASFEANQSLAVIDESPTFTTEALVAMILIFPPFNSLFVSTRFTQNYYETKIQTPSLSFYFLGKLF